MTEEARILADDPVDPPPEDTMELSTEILIMLFLLMVSIMGGHFLKKKRSKYL